MPEVTPSYQGGSGTPLVLVHGFTASWRMWGPVLGELERNHAVFAPTLAGHRGGTVTEAGNGGVPGIADALERALDQAGIETAHLAGNSLGGWVALELASRGRAKSAVLFSPAGGWSSQRQVRAVGRKFRAVRRALNLGSGRLTPELRRPGFRKLALRDVMVHGDRVPAAAAAEFILDVVGTDGFDDFMEWAGGLEEMPVWEPMDIPIRIAWGEHDRILPYERFGAPYLAALPDAEFLMLPGVGHCPMYDDPALVARTILEVADATDAKEPARDRSRN